MSLSLPTTAAAENANHCLSNTPYSLLIPILSFQEQLGKGVELFILESGGNLSQNRARMANGLLRKFVCSHLGDPIFHMA